MIEIIALFILTRQIAKIVEPKGYKSGKYKFYAVLLWFAGEVVGLLLGLALVSSVLDISGDTATCALYIMALVGALIGAAIAQSIAKNLPIHPDLNPFGTMAPPLAPPAYPPAAPPAYPTAVPPAYPPAAPPAYPTAVPPAYPTAVPPAAPPSYPPAAPDAVAKLQQLKQMLDSGLITPYEYEAKKAEILSKM